MNYLVDTSALVRILRRQADDEWYALVDRGLVSVCEPVLAETLMTADAKAYSDLDFETVARFVPELQQRRISARLN